jgi:hypothetical protein
MKLARIQINKQGEEFPIIGYSYYNYASSLKETRPDLSIVFSEYASEFSNLDMYFPREKKFWDVSGINLNKQVIGIFMLGIAAGILLVALVLFIFLRVGKSKNKSIDSKEKKVKNKKR